MGRDYRTAMKPITAQPRPPAGGAPSVNGPGRSRPLFVAVKGPTGVGKTTLAELLAPALGAQAMLDPFDAIPDLPVMLASDRPDSALALQVELAFLAHRIAQLRRIGYLLDRGRPVVADWALLKQAVFAATALSRGDAARIMATVEVWAGSVPVPDVMIGMSAAVPVLLARVRRRDRPMETSLTREYLAGLAAAFEVAYAEWHRPFVRLDAETFDAFDDAAIHHLAARIAASATLTGRP
jgi:deoxyguanosine kinase